MFAAIGLYHYIGVSIQDAPMIAMQTRVAMQPDLHDDVLLSSLWLQLATASFVRISG